MSDTAYLASRATVKVRLPEEGYKASNSRAKDSKRPRKIRRKRKGHWR